MSARHVVIGTAGHVDHGKTALVRLLTGVDTDRWEEEKRRGITIDLGFAPLALSDDLTASIVDVPGHEDFVRNMVAGATGVDVALMVVAADEGIMPQTEEHLAIVEFLGVRSGVVAITKSDLAEPEWLELVRSDVEERFRGSVVAWQPPVVCCATDGSGAEGLLSALARAARDAVERSHDDLFRMPVDRVFSVSGAGTVVTGSTWSGTVAVGDGVLILPEGVGARVRSIEVHGQPRERAEPGRRTALALPGVDRLQFGRGSVVVTGDAWRTTTALDARISLLPGSRPLTQRSRVRLHLGTAEVLARVTPAWEGIAPGATGDARLRLERPVVARWGDRGVIRSYSPVTTIGGCLVVDPRPRRRPRRPADLAERCDPDPSRRVLAFVTREPKRLGLPVQDLEVRLGIHPREVAAAVQGAGRLGVTRVGGRLVLESVLDELCEATLRGLEVYHREHPLEPGMGREAARRLSGAGEIADRVHQLLGQKGLIAFDGDTVRLGSHEAQLSTEGERLAEKIVAVLVGAGYEGRTRAELEREVGSALGPVLTFLVRQGTARRVGKGRYYERHTLDRLAREVVDELEKQGTATPAGLKERTGLSRKFLIPVLEWLDQERYTIREGDARRAGPRAPELPPA
ncbi:MAG: selenocysteine-specific translation elongation factor [Gemmatimonadales bacterium]